MSNMVEIFLKKIPQIIHEPIAVTAVIGIVLAVICYAKRPFGKFYWLVIAMLLYMFTWRLAIEIISSRYAELLLYPAAIAAAYACFKVPELIYPLIKKYIPEKIWRFLPYALVGGLCIACFCKAIRVSPYQPVLKMSEIVLEDRKKNGNKRALLFSEVRDIQYRYYTKLPTRVGPPLLNSNHQPNFKQIYRLIVRNRKNADIMYFIYLEPAKSQPLQLRSSKGPDPRWEFLGQEYINRKKRKVSRVYRFKLR